MARHKTAAPKQRRRPRAEIDRNYFMGDVFIKTGVAVELAILLISLYSATLIRQAIGAHQYGYPIVLGTFVAFGGLAFVIGRHLRRSATQWEAD